MARSLNDSVRLELSAHHVTGKKVCPPTRMQRIQIKWLESNFFDRWCTMIQVIVI
jgi:hypothetical protein